MRDGGSESARPVVLVTGAARRIGRAVVLAFAERGHDVLVHYRASAEAASETAAAARVHGASAHTLRADLSSDLDVAALAREALAVFGRVDVLVNNASRFEAVDVRTAPLSEVLSGLAADHAVHVRAPLALTLALAPALRARGAGAVVNIGDAVLARPGHVGYVATKAALRALTRSLARALAPEIRVNMVSPGAILAAHGDDAAFGRIVARVPLQRAGTPEEVAAAVHFLACTAGYVTGQDLAVDGG